MDRSRSIALILAGLAAVAALIFVTATPLVTTTKVELDGAVVAGSSIRSLWIVFAVTQCVALLAAVFGSIAVVRHKDRSAGISLGVATIAGLVPAIVPGVLAAFARNNLRKSIRAA